MDDQISDRGHLAGDLKLFFPRYNSFHFSKSIFSGNLQEEFLPQQASRNFDVDISTSISQRFCDALSTQQ